MIKDQKRGISFQILTSCLSQDFKKSLASGDLDINTYFNLDSHNAYRRLLYEIRRDVGWTPADTTSKVKSKFRLNPLNWICKFKNLLTR